LARQFRRLSNDAARDSYCREFTLSSILSALHPGRDPVEADQKRSGSAALFAIENLKSKIYHPSARVAKLADAPDLGSGGAILRGSSPLPGTISILEDVDLLWAIRRFAISSPRFGCRFPTDAAHRGQRSRFC